MPEKFLFLQGARHTCDAGNGATDAAQRLVQMACLLEKLIGHILARPFKTGIRFEGSGQLGIQEAAKFIQNKFSSPKEYEIDGESYTAKPTHATDNDISKFDAHIGDFHHGIVWEIMESLLDMTDDFTRNLYGCYRYAYDHRELVTAAGNIISKMLPSGASITTVFGFLLHETYIEAINSLHQEDWGTYGYVWYTIMGDDFVGSTDDIRVRESADAIYKAVGCELKSDSYYVKIDRNENPIAAIEFLGTLVYLNCPRVYTVPRGNFWYTEEAFAAGRQNLDNIIRQEIEYQCTDPSEIELHFASFNGKMRNFIDMRFFEHLFNYVMLNNQGLKLRSWLGERVVPESPVLHRLVRYEYENNIPEPTEHGKIIDRRQCEVAGPELTALMIEAILIIEQNTDMNLSGLIEWMTHYTKNTRKIKKLVQKVIPDSKDKFDLSIDEDYEKFQNFAKKLIHELGVGFFYAPALFLGTPQEVENQLAEAEASISEETELIEAVTEKRVTKSKIKGKIQGLQKLTRNVLGLGVQDPFGQKALVATGILDTRRDERAWRAMKPIAQEKLRQVFFEITRIELEDMVQEVIDSEKFEEDILAEIKSLT
jgi:hypothetical protein